MPRSVRKSVGSLGALVVCAGLAGTLSACRSVVVAPDDATWTVTGAGADAEATWETGGAGPVRVTVPLELSGNATMLTGTLRNFGSAVAFVTFVPSAEVDRRGLLGTLSGERPDVAGRWSATLYPGREIEVPAGTPGAPGKVNFALPPDHPWTAKEVPAVGETITWVINVAGESSEASCPVLFHVGEAKSAWMDDPRMGAAVTLVGLAGLIVWASYL